jgi:hypothetical protein
VGADASAGVGAWAGGKSEKGVSCNLAPRFPQLSQFTTETIQVARINFLADSLAALGVVVPRRSRDICAAERAKAKREHHVIRYEFYVECSCGYKGPSKDHACRRCGAKIQHFLQLNSFM